MRTNHLTCLRVWPHYHTRAQEKDRQTCKNVCCVCVTKRYTRDNTSALVSLQQLWVCLETNNTHQSKCAQLKAATQGNASRHSARNSHKIGVQKRFGHSSARFSRVYKGNSRHTGLTHNTDKELTQITKEQRRAPRSTAHSQESCV